MKRLVLAVLVSLTSCRDGGELHFDEAKRQHAQLVSRGTHPASPAFDPVLEELARVPVSSRRFADAQRLREAIEAVRQPVRRPLAVAHKDDSTLPLEVAAEARACQRLAERIGRDGGMTPSALEALDACQRRVDALDEAAAHRDDALHPR